MSELYQNDVVLDSSKWFDWAYNKILHYELNRWFMEDWVGGGGGGGEVDLFCITY